jgi:hypothetical protein
MTSFIREICTTTSSPGTQMAGLHILFQCTRYSKKSRNTWPTLISTRECLVISLGRQRIFSVLVSTYKIGLLVMTDKHYTDGGEVRGLYSLHILKQLMDEIRSLETVYVDREGKAAPATSSFHPLEPPQNASHGPSSSHYGPERGSAHDEVFLPCHYFDCICGTSTGG